MAGGICAGLTTQYWPFNYQDELVINKGVDIESERRLLYVTITRAKEALHLFTIKSNHNTSTKLKRMSEGAGSRRITSSPFMHELQIPSAQMVGALLHENSDEKLLDYCRQNECTDLTYRYLAAVKPAQKETLAQAQQQRKKHGNLLISSAR